MRPIDTWIDLDRPRQTQTDLFEYECDGNQIKGGESIMLFLSSSSFSLLWHKMKSNRSPFNTRIKYMIMKVIIASQHRLTSPGDNGQKVIEMSLRQLFSRMDIFMADYFTPPSSDSLTKHVSCFIFGNIRTIKALRRGQSGKRCRTESRGREETKLSFTCRTRY